MIRMAFRVFAVSTSSELGLCPLGLVNMPVIVVSE
jgi:hypothetical protein